MWSIFLQDLKNISTNWVAAVVIGGLIFLPSLYAWLNIKASWDPYGQTDQIPVAIVNEDEGETVRGEDIQVGNDLVHSLKENDSMDWHFVSREIAMEKLEKGTYFAVIIIPEDFSKSLATVIQRNPQKASVEYYVNEKINAIAPKITQKGASVIVEEVSSNFIATVNGVIFEMFNQIGLEIEKDLPDIKRFESYVFEMEKKLPEIHDTLNESLEDATRTQSIVTKAQGEIPKADTVLSNGMDTVDNIMGYLNDAEEKLNNISPDIKENIAKAQKASNEINQLIEEIESVDSNYKEGLNIQELIQNSLNESLENMYSVQTSLEYLGEQLKKTDGSNDELIEHINKQLENVEEIQKTLTVGGESAKDIKSFLDDHKKDLNQTFASIKKLSLKANNRISEFSKEYDEIEPKILEELSQAKETLTSARIILQDIQSTIPEVKDILQNTNNNLEGGIETIEKVLDEYPFIHNKVTELANKVRKIQNEVDISEVIELLQNDPEAERSFFAEPIQLKENKVFPIENYGTGMTPFYTVLSLWVGGLLLISLLSTDVRNPEQYKLNDIYFGKLITFLLAGLLQTLIVTLGDIFILEVNVAHRFFFVLFGLFCSFVFITIIYTLVSIFGDVGKAMAIIMLVLQIAGSGGTYPVVLLPKLFQMISPFLPFTYAVDIMREAVGGIVWSNVSFDLMILSVFTVITIIVGSLLKEPISKHTNKLMKKSKESGLFH